MDATRATNALRGARRILVFTGAGMSTESGIPDFRGPDGLWSRLDPDDFTIDRYLSDADVRRRTWQMHLEGAMRKASPNAAHHAVVELWQAERWAGCITQNIDGLHQAAGLPQTEVAELHGNIRRVRCLDCSSSWDTDEVLGWVAAGESDPRCPECAGIVKTSTVLFGEYLPAAAVQRATTMIEAADAVLAVGTTLSVWPAAGMVAEAARRGAPVVIVNLGRTDGDHLAEATIDGKAGDILPGLVAAVVGEGR